MAVVDPHGDLYNELLELIPPERASDVVLLDPTDAQFPPGINLLEYQNVDERHYNRARNERHHGAPDGRSVRPARHEHDRAGVLSAHADEPAAGDVQSAGSRHADEFYEIYQKADFWKKMATRCESAIRR